ncbi:uncharacterized protein [Trachinotus anak]|uniref:uncharacterized protein n=1 Tax=Trachinotus anak TaxID=443729 RepID=UPI0039F21ACB
MEMNPPSAPTTCPPSSVVVTSLKIRWWSVPFRYGAKMATVEVADSEGGVIVVFLGQHLQVEGGDDPRRAGQEGERGEVWSRGGRQRKRLDKWSSSNCPLCLVFILLPLQRLSRLLLPVTIFSSRVRLSSISTHSPPPYQSLRLKSWTPRRLLAEAWSSPSGCSSRHSETDRGIQSLIWTGHAGRSRMQQTVRSCRQPLHIPSPVLVKECSHAVAVC